MIFISNSPVETQGMAAKILNKILKPGREKALVIALEGELGAGKTTFAKGFAKALKIKQKIKSPTFVLMKKYAISEGHLYHFDCYRLRDHKDLIPLEIKHILNEPSNIVLIEWSDRVKKILPKKYTKIHIDHLDKNKRKLTIIYA